MPSAKRARAAGGVGGCAFLRGDDPLKAVTVKAGGAISGNPSRACGTGRRPRSIGHARTSRAASYLGVGSLRCSAIADIRTWTNDACGVLEFEGSVALLCGPDVAEPCWVADAIETELVDSGIATGRTGRAGLADCADVARCGGARHHRVCPLRMGLALVARQGAARKVGVCTGRIRYCFGSRSRSPQAWSARWFTCRRQEFHRMLPLALPTKPLATCRLDRRRPHHRRTDGPRSGLWGPDHSSGAIRLSVSGRAGHVRDPGHAVSGGAGAKSRGGGVFGCSQPNACSAAIRTAATWQSKAPIASTSPRPWPRPWYVRPDG